MSVTLIQPALSASAVPLFAYNPPSPPNVYNCDEYYAYPTPPLIADCRQAFKLLPNGPTPEPFYTEPGADRQHVLPLSVHYGQQPPRSYGPP